MILPDRMIREDGLVHPLLERVEGPEIYSYGLGPAGYDCTLADEFRAPGGHSSFHASGFVSLAGGHSLLCRTQEVVRIPDDCCGHVWPKSSYSRQGLVLITSPLEPGWRGTITLEVVNIVHTPIKLRVGQGICQVQWTILSGDCERPYSGRYQDQTGIKGAYQIEPRWDDLGDEEDDAA